jgi:hypothetical protein
MHHNDRAASGVQLDTMGMEFPMPLKRLNSLQCSLLGGVLLAATACTPVHVPPPTLSDLLEDRVLLDGIILKCNHDPQMSQCSTARLAIAQLAAEREAAETAARQAKFERSREQLRQEQEKQRVAQESAHHVDAYSLPLVPTEPAQPAP